MDYKDKDWLKDSLCKNLLFFLFEALKAKSKEVFLQIKESFSRTIKRDQDIEKAFGKIGKGMFGVSDGSGIDMMSMLGSMFG